jgi:hypothetical protein
MPLSVVVAGDPAFFSTPLLIPNLSQPFNNKLYLINRSEAQIPEGHFLGQEQGIHFLSNRSNPLARCEKFICLAQKTILILSLANRSISNYNSTGGIIMLKTFSLCRDFLIRGIDDIIGPKYVKIGPIFLTFSLLKTPLLSSESKLVYAYLFSHRRDGTGLKIPVLSKDLLMTQGRVFAAVKELETKKHIKWSTATRNDELSIFASYYEIVNPAKYGMLNLENNH